MFYSQFILAKKGPLGTIWIAAHLERKLKKNQVADTDIGDSVDSILFPDVPIALRLSSHLLLGVVRIYSRKVNYLFHDCSEALLKVKQAFRSTAVDLPPEESTAPYHSITLPETFDLDDFELPDSALNGNFDDRHVSSREQITLQDTLDGTGYSTSQFGLDERFGDGDASQIGLDLDEELLLDNNLNLQHDSVSYGNEHKGEGASDLTKMDMDETQLGCDEDRNNKASKALSELLCNDRGKHVISDVQNVNRIADSSHRLVFNIQTPDLNEAFLPDDHIAAPSGAQNIDVDFAAPAPPSLEFNEFANFPSTPIPVNCQELPVSNPQEILPYTDIANGKLKKTITQEVECPDATNENLVNATSTDQLDNVAQNVSSTSILDVPKSYYVAPQCSGEILASSNSVNNVRHIHNNSKDAPSNGNLISVESTYPKLSEVSRVLPSNTLVLTEAAAPDSVMPPCADGTFDTSGLVGLESILRTAETSRAGIVGSEATDLPVSKDSGNPYEDTSRLSNLDRRRVEYEDTSRLSNLERRQVEYEDAFRLSNLERHRVAYEGATRLSNLDRCRVAYEDTSRLSNLNQRRVEYEDTARLSNLDQRRVADEDTTRLSNHDQRRVADVDTARLSNLDQRRVADKDTARLSNLDQHRVADEDTVRLSNLDQRRVADEDTARLSNLDQRRVEYEDTTRISNLDQRRVADEDTTRLSNLDQRRVADEDTARLSNLDQRRVADEDTARLSNLDQRRVADEDTARLSNLDQRRVEYEDTARLSNLNQRRVADEDTARLSNLDQRRVAFEDIARLSNLDQPREGYEDTARLSNLDQHQEGFEDTVRLSNLEQRRVEEAQSYQTNNVFALSSDFQLRSCTSVSNHANLISPDDMLLEKTPGFFSRDQPCSLERSMVDQELHFSGFSLGLQGFPSVAIDTNLGSHQKSNDIQLGHPNCFSSSEFSEPERMLFAPSGNRNLSSDFWQQTIEKGVIESDGSVDRIGNLCGQKRHLVDNTPESQNDISPNEFGIPRKKQNTDYIIPKDGDLLASILVGRRTPALKTGPTPPLPKPPSSKRPRLTQKVGLPKRRKVLLDDTIVLHADAIRQQLMNTEDLRRMRRKAPCTRPEIWRIQKSFVEDDNIFCESIFIGISDELNSLLIRRYDPVQNMHAQDNGHHSSGDAVREFEVSKSSPLARDNDGREIAVQSPVVTERVDSEIHGASGGELIDAQSCQKAVSIDAQEQFESPFVVPFDSQIDKNRNNGLADAEHNSLNKEFQTLHQIAKVNDNALHAADLVSLEEFTSADCVAVNDVTSVQVEDLTSAKAASIAVEDMGVDNGLADAEQNSLNKEFHTSHQIAEVNDNALHAADLVSLEEFTSADCVAVNDVTSVQVEDLTSAKAASITVEDMGVDNGLANAEQNSLNKEFRTSHQIAEVNDNALHAADLVSLEEFTSADCVAVNDVTSVQVEDLTSAKAASITVEDMGVDNGLANAEQNSLNKEFRTSHQIAEVNDNALHAADLVSLEEFTSADCVAVNDVTSVQVEDLTSAKAASITVEDMGVDNGLANAEQNSLNKEFHTSHQIAEVNDNALHAADLVSLEEFTSADCVAVNDGSSVQVEDLSNAKAESITVEDMVVDIVNVTNVDRLQDEQAGITKDHSDGASASMLDRFVVEVGADFPEDSSAVIEHANSLVLDMGMVCGGHVVDGEKAASEIICAERPKMASFPVPPTAEGERVPSAVGENSGMNAEGGQDVESTTMELAATRESSDFCRAIDDVDTGFLNVDDDAEYDEETFNDAPNTEAQSLENSGWSSRTRGVARYLKTMFDQESGRGRKSVAVDHLLAGKTRKEASRMFFETLVLKTRDYIHIEQDNPFSCINIKPRIKLLKTEF